MANSSSPWAWHVTPANNTTADPDSPILEPMAAGDTNDRMRDTRAFMRRFLDDTIVGIDTAGTSTAYTATTEQTITNLPDGFRICIVPHINSGADPTLAINAVAAISIKQMNGGAIAADYLVLGVSYELSFNEAANQLRLVWPLPAAITAEIGAATGIVFGDLTDYILATDDVALTGAAIWNSAASVTLTMDNAIAIDMKGVAGCFNFKLSTALNTNTTLSITNERGGAQFTLRFTCDSSARTITYPVGAVTTDGFAASRTKVFAASQSHMLTCYVPEAGVSIWGAFENLREAT